MSSIESGNKTLRQRDIALFSISAILLLDTLAAGAVVGPSIIFWWLFLGLIFFIPNALIVAELGSTYTEQGGIYTWVRDAFGARFAARVTWSYWINFAVWMPSVYILFASVFAQLFFPDLSLFWQIVIAIILSWLSVLVNIATLNMGKWVPNLGALLKVVIFLVLIIGGISYAINNGSANAFTLQSIAPQWGQSLQYLPVLIYGMLGFELISASSGEMQQPERDVPKGIFISGFIIITFYTLASAGILFAIPAQDINLVEGLIDTLRLLLGNSIAGQTGAIILGIFALYTFFSNGVTWALGCNRAIAEAAQEGEMPAFFGVENRKTGSPMGAAISAGAVSTVLLLLFGYLAGTNEDLFWDLFAFSAVLFLLPYVGMSLAFMKLRKIDAARPRPFKIPGGPLVANICTWLTVSILIITIALLFYVPEDGMQWSVFIGTIILMLVGEVFIRYQENSKRS